MAQYKALVTFSGTVTMSVGEVKDLAPGAVVDDLIRCGYIAPAEKEGQKNETKRGKHRSG